MSLLETRAEERRKTLKQGVDGESALRQREDEAVQLRKNKRTEALAKKRMVEPTGGADQENCANGIDDTPSTCTVKDLPELAAAIQGQDRDVALAATRNVRKLLSAAEDAPIKQVVSTGVMPRLVQFLSDAADADLQFEAAWALTNVASGDGPDTQLVASLGTIPFFTRLLASPSDNVKEQAVWALANMSGENAQLRDEVIESALFPIMRLVESVGREVFVDGKKKLPMLRNAAWALANLFRGTPSVDAEKMVPALSLLAGLMQVDDVAICMDACWGASFFTHETSNARRLEVAKEAGLGTAAVKVLGSPHTKLLQPAMRVAGNFVAGEDSGLAQVLLDAGLLSHIPKLLTHKSRAICKEAMWILSNIAGGTPEQVVAILSSGVMTEVFMQCSGAMEDVSREGVYVLSNICFAGGAHTGALVNLGGVSPLCSLLSHGDDSVVSTALHALEKMLVWGASVGAGSMQGNPVMATMEREGAVHALESLQETSGDEVYNLCITMMEEYFGGVDAESNPAAPLESAESRSVTFNFS